MRASPLALATVVLTSVLVPGLASAQTTYNVDGTPQMIAPDGTFVDGSAPGSVPQGQGAIVAPSAQSVEERYDIDCDPDIEVCVDPNEQQDLDDGYDPNAYQQFESALQPYGTWFDDPTYGRVWAPSPEIVGSDFQPYATDGQWVASNDYGMAWASDYDWGWAPFHYGRWLLLNGWGWAWVPGTIWGPAWVDWRYGGGYCGWAPLPPRGVIIPPPRALGSRTPWRFALTNELFRRNPTFVPTRVVQSVWSRTAPVRNARTVAFGSMNARINLGPPVATISRDLGRPVPTLALKNSAPSTLPRSTVVARAGVPIASRPYARAVAPAVRAPVTLPHQVAPAPRVAAPPHYPLGAQYSAPSYPPARNYAPQAQTYSPPAYRAPVQTYSPPAYHAPAQTYAPPAYRAPVQTYSPPVYHAPVQTYSPPAYHAPAQTYHAPAPTYAPSYSAPPAARSYAPAPAAPAPAPAHSSSRPAMPSFSPATRRH